MKAQERKRERERLKQLKESQNPEFKLNPQQKRQQSTQESQNQSPQPQSPKQSQIKKSIQISGPIMQIMSDDLKRQKSKKKKILQIDTQLLQQIEGKEGKEKSRDNIEANQIEELEKLIKMFNLSVYNNNIWIEQNNHYYKSKLENEELKKAIIKAEREIEEINIRNSQTTAAYIDTIHHCGRDLEKVVLKNAIELKKQNQMLQDEIEYINKKISSEAELLSKELKDNNRLIEEIGPLEEDLTAEIESVKKLKKQLMEIKEDDEIPLDLLNRINSLL